MIDIFYQGYRRNINDIEDEEILGVLQRANYVVRACAGMLGVRVSELRKRLEALGFTDDVIKDLQAGYVEYKLLDNVVESNQRAIEFYLRNKVKGYEDISKNEVKVEETDLMKDIIKRVRFRDED